MCAIAGAKTKKEVLKMLKIMKHRGPDDSGTVTYRHSSHEEYFTVGMDRLSIIDLKSKNLCPYTSRGQTIVFNGELYNYIELREELREYGWFFETESDTEVVLKAYQHWGVGCLDRFNGMFAFAISDLSGIFLARDMTGEKPLYYRTEPHNFAFSSEAKALKGAIDMDNIFFDTFQHCRLGTLYKDVKELLPAHYMKFEFASGACSTYRYWEFKPRYINEDTVLEEFDSLFGDAVRIRQRSDAGYGLYASGGVDSTLIQLYGNFKGQYSFTYMPEELDKADFERNIEKIVYHLDFPVGSFSSYGLFSLARDAKKHRQKVIMSGEGADEVFGGYVRYLPVSMLHWLDMKYPSYKPLFKKLFASNHLARYMLLTNRSDESSYVFMKGLMRPFFNNYDPLTAMQLFDFTYILPSLLQMGDRMSGMFGIENRCPFLDRRIIEFGLSLPMHLKISNLETKVLLRRALGVLNKRVNLPVEKEKTGLLVPYNKWYGIKDYNRDHYFSRIKDIWIKQNSAR